VNPGGEPERDETGLPPVDIEIPDDARELDGDVHAYYRELRAQRREQRGLRVRGSLAKDGIVLPVLACCLILALITGTLLTVFTATSDQFTGLPLGQSTAGPPAASRSASGGATSAPAGSSAAASAGSAPTTPQPSTVPGLLPRTTIAFNGQAAVPVQELSRAALVLIPSHCNCTATVSWLIHVVTGAHAQPYLIYTAGTKGDVNQLYARLSSGYRAQVLVATAPDNKLRTSIPATLDQDGLAAIMIGPKKVALYATGLGPHDDPTTLIRALTH
jgi:hypothetical protein